MVNTINCRDTIHFDSEDDYRTGFETSVTDHAPPTFEMTSEFKSFSLHFVSKESSNKLLSFIL